MQQRNLFYQVPERALTAPEHIIRLSTPTPAHCACCRRQGGPIGFQCGPVTLWSCRDQECKAAIRRIMTMSTPDFNEIEQDALKQGGRSGYEYLDSIGQGDVFELDAIQALEFFERVVDGFGCHMRARLVVNHELTTG